VKAVKKILNIQHLPQDMSAVAFLLVQNAINPIYWFKMQ